MEELKKEEDTKEESKEPDLTLEQSNVKNSQEKIVAILKEYNVQLIASMNIIGNQIVDHSVQIIPKPKKNKIITK